MLDEKDPQESLEGRVAIIGMAGRFPGARGLGDFWRNLRDGVESIRFLSREEMTAAGVSARAMADPAWVPAVAQPEGIEEFDAPFFGFSHREAEILDPQHRLFLETCWSALEDAGHAPGTPGVRGGVVSVYGGATTSTYLLFNLTHNRQVMETVDPLQLIVGNSVDCLTTRVSYKLDLQGASQSVQSACSTSLVAVHLACQALLHGECDMALAGGVSINVGQRGGYRFQEDSILSPDGHCRAFDAAAAGTVFGSGVGVVVLKRLEDALRDGDPIRAVILGSATNNDGAVKVGYTAPSVEGQAAAITEALAVADVEPGTLSYLEAHGTGTSLGDPVEIKALARAFGPSADRVSCALGSVKSNIGHLDIASGVAGLIKTVLALEHRQIPPSLHFERPNPRIDFAHSPVFVNRALTDWVSGGPRRAGVSSFGFGGTNAHVILEEAPVVPRTVVERPWRLLVLSAKTEEALAEASRNLARHLREHPEIPLGDVSWTLLAGRRTFTHRRAVVCRDAADAAACLESLDPSRVMTAVGEEEPREQPGAVVAPDEAGSAEALEAVGRAWLAGVRFDPRKLFPGETPRRVSLPTYPFARHRYWIEPGETVLAEPLARAAAPAQTLHARPDLPTAYTAPRSEAEERVAAVWREVLGVAEIGVHDSFLELGGDSLLATRLVARLRERLGMELPMDRLFEAPTVAAVAVLDARTEVDRIPADRIPVDPIPRQLRDGDLPVSFAQQRLWFLDRLEPGSPLYNIPSAIEAEGRLDAAALAASLREVVRRQEALRTTFAARAGQPVQVIHPRMPVELPVVDLAALPEAVRTAEAERLATAEARRPFDLARGPLFRALLLRLAPERHLAAFTFHHIVSDGWSMGVLVREIAALYPGGAGGTLPELKVQPADVAAWQRGRLQREALEKDLAFWRETLAGVPLVLDLPTDRPRPALQTFRGAQMPVRLEPELTAALRAAGRGSGHTLFMQLLGAFGLLLGRWSGQEALLVGSPVSGRARPEVQGLIGFFVQTLPLRVDLRGEPSLGELLRRVKETELAAFAHQDLPFGRLVEEIHPDRDLSRSPLFQVMFALQKAEAEALRLPGLTLRSRDLDTGTAKFELTLQLAEGAESVAGWIEYNTGLFDAATVERMAGQLTTLLRAFPGALESPAFELPLLPDNERLQLLDGWNDTERRWPAETLVHELFEQQAARTPDAPAVSCDGVTLTYRELAERSHRLARHLRRLGVGPEARVGLCVERSAEMVVALLGILQAGGAYVPLDPAHPAERIALVLEDSGVSVLVTEERLLAGLPGLSIPRVCLDRDAEKIVAEPSGPLPRRFGLENTDPDNLAYVLYTSGSTGRPKGVQLPHRALVNLLRSVLEWPGVGPGDVTLALTTLTFDVAAFEIYAPLAVGGRIEVASREEATDGRRLAARIAASRPTLVQGTPATWRLLVDSGWRGDRNVRAVTAGEPLPRDLAEAVLARSAELWNLYGPTETAVYSAGCRVVLEDGLIVIGRPVANTELFVVDRRLSPVPLGAAGELLIGGAGLSRGYLGQPDLTAEKFIPHPWAGDQGARLYRTGDLVRYRPSADLEYLGRIDQQVKVRGFRIELGEIEAALRRAPGVRQAVVTAQGGGADRRLIAYLVAEGAAPGAGELREHLRRTLPDYMLPAAFVPLAAFPLTPSGKVDRKALPAFEPGRESAVETAYVQPRSALERTIAGLWRDVLKLDRVGVDDSFFDLGGHSLLAAQVQAGLEEALGREVALVDLFRHPTVATLAAFLGGAAGSSTQAGLARAAARREAAHGLQEEAVALIGMSGRFPGADGIERFWENLKNGVESISFFTEEELRAAGVAETALADPRYVRARGIVERADEFDAPFFGYSPREAEVIDPQQRVFLECAWEAFEDAGHDPARFPGDVGVFAGSGMNTYVLNFLAEPESADSVGLFQLMIGNDKDYLAPRVSYKLGLSGPSISVQTGCSTSLVAVHLACQSLLAGECDAALAGGISIRFPQTTGYNHPEGGVFSPDGHCRSFDAASGGFVGGNGAAVVVLRRLSDALRDGDPIRAVIRGSAVNNDGALRAGFTAPGVDGQVQVVAQALAVAGVEPGSIGYVEAHGTATELGDPIEVAALTQAFAGAPQGAVWLGSVKSNVGHLDSAAGLTGLLKAALALEHGQIPPTLHFERPNPKLRLEESPFRVAGRLTDWPPGPVPRRAGVSSLGIGGTNAHVILEEAPAAEPGTASRPWQLLVLSARTPAALDAAAERLAAFLRERPGIDFADVAHTLRVGRRGFAHRLALVCRDREDALAVLAGEGSPRLLRSEAEDAEPPVTFLFPGLGEHYPGMAADLYRGEPAFRAALDECCDLLVPHLGVDLRRLLFPEGSAEAGAGVDVRALFGRRKRTAGELDRTLHAQPAVFAVEYALAQLLLEWGIRPQSLLGYSLGEYVAACVGGVLPLADALALVARRARLIDGLPAGAMLAVPLSEDEARPLLGDELSIAAANGPALVVASGPEAAIVELERRLAERGLTGRRLPTTHAFHSRMMEPVREAFAEMVAGLRLAPPRIPFLSNLTGTWITAEEATDPGYWVRHLCDTVRFGDGLAELSREPGRVLVEVGPGQGLTALALQAPGGLVAIPTLRSSWDRQPDGAFLLGALARLWLAGVRVDWTGFAVHERRRRVPLPTYPFERQRYFVDPPQVLRRPAAREPEREREATEAPRRHARPGHLRNAYAAPSTELERQLAGVWQQVLGIEAIGVHDNFFELGGHSLLATQVMSRLREGLGLDLPLDSLFDHPTLAGLAERAAASRQEGGREALPPILPVADQGSRGGSFPLSFSQERMWLLHQLDPASPAYNLIQPLRLRGRLDVAVLARCFGEVERRHESLRTTFQVEEGQVEEGRPVQRVHPPAGLLLPVVDLAALPAGRREGESKRLAAQHQLAPFDLARGPFLRAALVRLDAEDHALFLTMHHIASDGWSFGVLVSELAALYTAFLAEEPSPLPELAVQYPDYAVWQRQALAGAALEAETEWWQRRLAGDPPPLHLPADRRRAEVQGFQAEEADLELPAELVAGLRDLSRRQSASLYMTLLAAWKTLLVRLTAEEDLLLGAPIANRNRAEIEGLIGFFLNTLLLRTDLAGNPPFGEALARVRETALGAFAHQDLPLEMVLQAWNPERDPGRGSPFQIMFLLQNLPAQERTVPGLTFSLLEADLLFTDLETAVFEAGLTLVEHPDRGTVAASLTYNGLLFDRASMTRLLERYRRVLAAAVADPARRLWEVDLLGEVERAELVGQKPASPGLFIPVHRVFAQRAAENPARVAVISGERSLTYGELDRRANRLAQELRSLGVEPETVVGVALERSPELIVSLLAVLKAGGAYVPLDPADPQERLAYILEDARAAVLLTTSAVLAALPALDGRVLPVLVDLLAGESAAAPGIEVDADHLAYLIYTSGSTGRPKGVMVRHGALAGYVASFRAEHGLGPADRVLQFASIGFDTSAEEIYPCLTSGAGLVLRDDSMLVSTPDFLRACGALGITVLDLPTAFWHQWTVRLVEEALELPAALRLLILGGERVLPERLAAWNALAPHRVRLFNTYGPTETTIVATRCELAPDRAVPGEVPIGGPVPGARAYVVDPFLELAPPGVPGELCVAGTGLARGYLGRPDLTAERFLPDPWAAAPGERLYRTGDLVRRSGAGDLEFVGRVDDQVKVRGYRVELREIEAHLRQHPGVAAAVVVAFEETPGDRRLAAYVVPHEGIALAVGELRAFLRERLPDYMVPAAVVALEALPLTPSGKVDRRALPAPESLRPEGGAVYEPPASPAEETIAAIWQAVLGVERIGATDNFFELGGHSLLLPQVMHRLRSAFRIEIPLRTLFDEQTVEKLALAVEEILLEELERELGALEGADHVVG